MKTDLLFATVALLALRGTTSYAEDASFAVPPMLQFTSPSSATVVWESTAAGTGAVAFGKTRKLGTVITAKSDGAVHTVSLTDLEPGQTYHYKVGTTVDGKRRLSPAYEFNTGLNFSVPRIPNEPLPDDPIQQAQSILKRTGVHQGYCLVIGHRDAAFLEALADQSDLLVFAVEEDLEKAEALRKALHGRAVYGSRVSVLETDSFDRLPVTPCFANLILAEAAKAPIPDSKLGELLVPGGGKLCYLSDGRIASVRERPPLKGIGEWTHQYGDPGNTASNGETLSGARATEDLVVQWVGQPGGDFGIDRNPRMPAPVAAGGRMFHQGLNRVAAMDAYNGSVLWSLEIPDLRRVNIPRDCSNWCVNADQLFMAIRDRAWIHEAATGKRIAALPVPKNSEGEYGWGYIAHAGNRLFGSAVLPDAAYTNYWGGDKWYEGERSTL